MPAFSGLWDAVHGQPYNNMPKSDAQPPVQRGIVRALMQGRGMHGHVTALGRNAPSAIAQVDASRGDLTGMRGTFDYATRTDQFDYDLDNGGNGGYSGESIARPTNATEEDMSHTYDTTLRNAYAADEANSGQTATAQTEVISDGS